MILEQVLAERSAARPPRADRPVPPGGPVAPRRAPADGTLRLVGLVLFLLLVLGG